jgi:hypothetical protein
VKDRYKIDIKFSSSKGKKTYGMLLGSIYIDGIKKGYMYGMKHERYIIEERLLEFWWMKEIKQKINNMGTLKGIGIFKLIERCGYIEFGYLTGKNITRIIGKK